MWATTETAESRELTQVSGGGRTQIADDSESESDHQEDESVGESETEPQTGAAPVLDAAPLANEAGDDEAALDMADDPAPSEEWFAAYALTYTFTVTYHWLLITLCLIITQCNR